MKGSNYKLLLKMLLKTTDMKSGLKLITSSRWTEGPQDLSVWLLVASTQHLHLNQSSCQSFLQTSLPIQIILRAAHSHKKDITLNQSCCNVFSSQVIKGTLKKKGRTALENGKNTCVTVSGNIFQYCPSSFFKLPETVTRVFLPFSIFTSIQQPSSFHKYMISDNLTSVRLSDNRNISHD